MSERVRKPTAKGAEYTASLEAKKTAALTRIKNKRDAAKTQQEVDELTSLFTKVTVAQADADIDALTAQLGRMGGRKRKTHRKKYKNKKTRKH